MWDAAPLRILGRANAFNVRKVLWAVDEIGIPFEREDWGRGYKPCSSAEFLALNPAARVPVVIDGDNVMRESNTIIRYLAHKARAETLYPGDPSRRQKVEQWMDWASSEVWPALRGVFFGVEKPKPEFSIDVVIKANTADLTRLLKLADDRLVQTGAYLAGTDFTIADIPFGQMVNRFLMMKNFADRPDVPAVAAYYERLGERPAYRAHVRNGLA